MHISEYSKCLTLDHALQLVKANTQKAFIWHTVDNGFCKFELGGSQGHLKAYIPEYLDGKVVIHSNDYVKSSYSLELDDTYIFFDGFGHRTCLNENASFKTFMNLLRQDLKNCKPETYQVPVTKYETKVKLNFQTL